MPFSVPNAVRMVSAVALLALTACGDSVQPGATDQPNIAIAPVDVDGANAVLVTSCVNITSPGGYRLTQDLICNGSPAFTISANDVTLSLNGYNITGNYSFNGPTITGHRVWIRGPGKVQHFQNGIQVVGTSFRASNVEFLDDLNGAIHFEATAKGGAVNASTFSGGGYAGFSTAADSMRVVNNTFTGHTVALLFNPASTGHLIEGNTVANSSAYGLQFDASNTRVFGNSFSTSASGDIYYNCSKLGVRFRNNSGSVSCFP
jgi:hypothetical protein